MTSLRHLRDVSPVLAVECRLYRDELKNKFQQGLSLFVCLMYLSDWLQISDLALKKEYQDKEDKWLSEAFVESEEVR